MKGAFRNDTPILFPGEYGAACDGKHVRVSGWTYKCVGCEHVSPAVRAACAGDQLSAATPSLPDYYLQEHTVPTRTSLLLAISSCQLTSMYAHPKRPLPCPPPWPKQTLPELRMHAHVEWAFKRKRGARPPTAYRPTDMHTAHSLPRHLHAVRARPFGAAHHRPYGRPSARVGHTACRLPILTRRVTPGFGDVL